VGGFLQLLFLEFGIILAGLAAASLVAGWASDETSGRLEMLLATPLAKVRWVLAGGVGVLAGIIVFTALTMAGIGIGAVLAGGEAWTPVLGTVVLALFAMAMAGVGIAVGGLVRSGLAGPIVVVVTVVTWLIQLIGPALNLPEFITNLALPSHYGLPMVGEWDMAGVIASVVIALGGVAIGAWGFSRRDLSG
jgi:ABC-2 type transport system permease protein